MWKHKRLFFVAGGILIAAICAQLLYPYDMALPLARSQGSVVGFRTRNELAAQFQQQFESASVAVVNGDRTATRKLSALGATLNADRMADTLTAYPLWLRFIPFSAIIMQPQVKTLDVELAGTKLQENTASIATELSYSPTDATLAINDGKLAVVAARNGKTVTAKDVRSALITTQYTAGITKMTVKAVNAPPARADADIATAKAQAELALSRTITLNIQGKGEFTPDVATRASWLVIKLDVTPATLTVDRDKVLQYVNGVNGKVAVAPQSVTVTVVDGNETGRSGGANGSALDTAAVTDELSVALIDGAKPATVTAAMQPVAPGITYARSYTNSQEGLRAYVAYATSTQNVRIVVQQLDGPGWGASGRADESLPSASTYKLFVAKMLFKKMDEGAIHWDDPILDTNVSGCFDRMTIASTNPCAVEWLQQFGRDNMNDYVHSLGFSGGTSFTHPTAVHTTAGDLAKFMIGLENGSLIGGDYRNRLYQSLSSHPYRNGIPTGVKGTVYDKVGFLWDYVHDSAIVYGPKGTYVLVIMTKGYSYAYIANVARQIESIMYP